MIKILAIDHIVIRTEKPQTMIDFYINLLGCTLERDLGAEFGLTQLRAGNALIDIVAVDGVLGKRGGPAPKPTGNNMDHFCLQIEPVDETILLEYLKTHRIRAGEFTNRYGAEGFGRSIYIADPDGNTIELKSAA